jgi:ribonuclease P protein component
VLWIPGSGPVKAGFAVSRQLRSAVQRNRARRLLREAFRQADGAPREGVQVVLIARPSLLERRLSEIVGEVNQALATVSRELGMRSARRSQARVEPA